MEAELTDDGEPVPGLAPADHGAAALAERETTCYSGDGAVQPRPLPHRLRRRPDRRGREDHLLARHLDPGRRRGQLRPLGEQRRYTTPTPRRCSSPTSSRARCRRSCRRPDQNANIDRCWTCRSMVMQAWGHYGTAWPVIHQQLGVRPSLGTGRLEVVPQVPDGQPSVPGATSGSATGPSTSPRRRASTTVTVAHAATRAADRADAAGAARPRHARRPHGAQAGRARTNRGVEVTVKAPPARAPHPRARELTPRPSGTRPLRASRAWRCGAGPRRRAARRGRAGAPSRAGR